ncbi:hypothetical protein RI367_003045 [Sorochytrium milnesiophthora]
MSDFSLQLTGTAASLWKKPTKAGAPVDRQPARQKQPFQPSLRVLDVDFTQPTVHTSPLRPGAHTQQPHQRPTTAAAKKHVPPTLPETPALIASALERTKVRRASKPAPPQPAPQPLAAPAHKQYAFQPEPRPKLPNAQTFLGNYNHRNVKKQTIRNVEKWRMEELALRRLRYVIDQDQITAEHYGMLTVLESSQVPGAMIQKYFGQSISSVHELRIILNKLTAQRADSSALATGPPLESKPPTLAADTPPAKVNPRYERKKGLSATPLDLLKIVEAAYPIALSEKQASVSNVNLSASAAPQANVRDAVRATTGAFASIDDGQPAPYVEAHSIHAFCKPVHHCYGHCPSHVHEEPVTAIHRDRYRTKRDRVLKESAQRSAAPAPSPPLHPNGSHESLLLQTDADADTLPAPAPPPPAGAETTDMLVEEL